MPLSTINIVKESQPVAYQSLLLALVEFPDGSTLGLCTHDLSVVQGISGATNASPIVVNVVGHGLSTGNQVVVDEVAGNWAAVGTWTITVVDSDHFSLNSSIGNAAYLSGTGTVRSALQYGGVSYLPRVSNMGIVARQALSADGVDITPSISLVLADGDKAITQNYEFGADKGFLGSIITLTYVHWSVNTNQFTSDSRLVFSGICDLPDIQEDTITIRANSKTNFTKQKIPNVAIQRTCPWQFPQDKDERIIAAVTGVSGLNINLFRCGYSPDIVDADVVSGTASSRGNYATGTTPFTECGYTRSDCMQRMGNPATTSVAPDGDIAHDKLGRATGTFGGITFEPNPLSTSKGYVSGHSLQSTNSLNLSKYGDVFPQVYGTVWITPKIMHAVGDQNLTAMEAVLCVGQIDRGLIQQVVVSGVNIAQSGAGGSTIAGFWNVVSDGGRHGALNADTFYDKHGDPYGSLACLHIRVPNALAAASAIPDVQVLFTGPHVRIFFAIASASASGGVITIVTAQPNGFTGTAAGQSVTIEGCTFAAANGTWVAANATSTGFDLAGSSATGSGTGGYYYNYTSLENVNGSQTQPGLNLTWAMIDVLLNARMQSSDIDIPAAIASAAIDDFQLTYVNNAGATASHARYCVGLPLTQPQTVASVLRGLRNAGRKMIIPNGQGGLRILSKLTLADQQPTAVDGSNYNTPVASIDHADNAANGYVAYNFDETSVLDRNGKSTLRLPGRAITDIPNELSCQFQDADNAYVVDSYQLDDTNAVTRWGQEVPETFEVLGLCNYDQAKRALNTQLAENFLGNEDALPDSPKGTRYIEWETTFRGSHLQVGDIVFFANVHYGIARQLFRLTKVQPAQDQETIAFGAIWHEDEWYTDLWGQIADALFTGVNRSRSVRPPFPWRAFETAPAVGDPWYDPTEYFFGIAQSYENAADRTAIAHISITGKEPANSLSRLTRPPLVVGQGTTATTGGTLKGGLTYWFKICAKDATGATFGLSAGSGFVSVVIPAGTDTNTATISVLGWDGNAAGYVLLCGTDPNSLSFQSMVDSTPSTIALTAYNVANYGEPDIEADHVEVDVYNVEHAGVFGAAISALTSTTFTVAGALWDVNQWAGYDCSITGFLDDPGDIAIANFTITSNTADTLTLAGGMPDPTLLGVEAGDAIIMRSLPGVAGNVITDANWDNSLANGPALALLGATNASPISCNVPAHGLTTGQRARIDDSTGNTAANGIWTVTVVDSDNFTLDTSTGNGAYGGSGVLRALTGGLTPSAEKGNRLVVVAGTGRGQWFKVGDNSATSITIEGNILVQPDSTSRYIIVDPAPQTTSSSAPVANSDPNTPMSIDLSVDNAADQSLAVICFAADADGNRSFYYLSQVREIYQFGNPGQGVTTLSPGVTEGGDAVTY